MRVWLEGAQALSAAGERAEKRAQGSALDVDEVGRSREDRAGERGRVPLDVVLFRDGLEAAELELAVGHAHCEQVKHLRAGGGGRGEVKGGA